MEIKLDLNVYPLEAIFNASFVFIERAYIFLKDYVPTKYVKVSLKAKRKVSQKKLNILTSEFKNELLHSALRYSISKNNKKIREYIIGRALFHVLPSENPAYSKDLVGSAKVWKKNTEKK